MEIFVFFLKSPCWKGKAFSGHDLLIDIPVLTPFLCEAFKWVLEIWPTDSGKKVSFCSDAHGWLPEGLMYQGTGSSQLCHDLTWSCPRCSDTSTQEPLSLSLMTQGHALNYLMERDEFSLKLPTEFLVVTEAFGRTFVRGKPASECRPFS